MLIHVVDDSTDVVQEEQELPLYLMMMEEELFFLWLKIEEQMWEQDKDKETPGGFQGVLRLKGVCSTCLIYLAALCLLACLGM